jgi:endonuclease/exonuclease/phosphatase family metal-dependent hydrolase
MFQSPRNAERAVAIAAELGKLDLDIICLEKVWDCQAQGALAKALSKRYPYRYGPANSSPSLRLSSGVMVFSRLPLSDYHEIQFRDCASIECLSRKGAIMLSGSFQGHPFHLVATHLQGEDDPRFTRANEAVRLEQMRQIQSELLARYDRPNVPDVLCGDFDTARHDDANPSQDSHTYQYMLALFSAVNGVDDRVTLDDNRWRNELAADNTGRTAELDYILLRHNGVNVRADWDRLILRNRTWDGPQGREDLSYRFAVRASIRFP